MSRHIAMTRAAGIERLKNGAGEDAILAALMVHPERGGLPERELRQIARDMARKPAGTPRAALPPNLCAVERFSLARGFAPSALAAFGARANGSEVHFPMRDASGSVVGWRRRRGDNAPFRGGAKCLSAKGSANGFMAAPWPLPAQGPVLLTESETDGCALATHKAAAVVATPGAHPGRACLESLQRVLAGRECVLFPDPDEAGRAWCRDVSRALLNAGATVRMVPALDVDIDKRLAREECPIEEVEDLVAAAIAVPHDEHSPCGTGALAGRERERTPGNAEDFRGPTAGGGGPTKSDATRQCTRADQGSSPGQGANAHAGSFAPVPGTECFSSLSMGSAAENAAFTHGYLKMPPSGTCSPRCDGELENSEATTPPLSSSLILHPSSLPVPPPPTSLASPPHPWGDGIGGAELWRTRPPRGFVVRGLVVDRSIVFVCGAAGGFKTAMAMSLAWSVAEGKPWLGMQTRACPVLWYNADMDTDEAVARLQAFGRGGGHGWQAPLRLHSFASPALRLDDPHAVDLLAAKALEMQAGLVVLDCLVAVKGEAEENSASEMAPVLQAVRLVAERTGAAVIVIHHTSRGEGSKYRGSSAIRDLADLTLHVTRDGETATIRPDKVRRNAPRAIAADFHFNHREGTDELWKAWFTPAQAGDESDRDEVAECILALLEEGPKCVRELIREAGKEGHSKRAVLAALPKLGNRVCTTQGANRSKMYVLRPEAAKNVVELPADDAGEDETEWWNDAV